MVCFIAMLIGGSMADNACSRCRMKGTAEVIDKTEGHILNAFRGPEGRQGTYTCSGVSIAAILGGTQAIQRLGCR